MKINTSVRLKQLMNERNLKQIDILRMSFPFQKELNIKMGKSTLSQYVNGIQSPDQDRIYLLSKTLGVSEPWLMGYPVPKERMPEKERNDINKNNSKINDISKIYNQLEKSRQKNVYLFAENQLEEQNKIIELPKKINLLGQTAAGAPIDYGDPEIEEKEFKTIPNGAQYALNVKGDSMEPLIKDGSIVFYKEQPSVETGEIAIIEIEGNGVTCKKVKFDYDNRLIILQSTNNKYDDLVLNDDQVRIIGKVVL